MGSIACHSVTFQPPYYFEDSDVGNDQEWEHDEVVQPHHQPIGQQQAVDMTLKPGSLQM